MRRTRLLSVVALAVMLMVAACASSSKKAAGPSSSVAAGSATTANTAGNTASDVGVTPTQITVGNVVTVTGPVPGLFAGSAAGTDAFFQYINSQGGVYGRKLVLKSSDDALNCNQNQTATQDLIGSVFAFVGSFSTYDNCGANVFNANPTVPDIHYLLSDGANAEVNGYSPQPAPAGFRTGPYQYYAQQFPNAVKHVGSLWANTSPTTWANQKAAEQSLGFNIVYERGVAPTETDFTADIVRMKSEGVQYLDLRNQDVRNIARVMNEAAQQNWHPQVIVTNSEYDPNFFKLLTDPSAGNGILTDQPFAMFLGEDSASTPEVALFLQWMKQTHPSTPVDLFAMYSWASGRLFVQALQAAGSNPTRAGVITALKNIHNFDSNGFVAPADVGNKQPPGCYMILKVQDGKFVRVNPADKGYLCTPTGYYHAKA
jgi:ABC-type branched-subunit amino acid transport system substrate-binding protein